MPNRSVVKPEITDAAAHQRFRSLVSAGGQDPDNPWIGGYVDYEWKHGRHVYETVQGSVCGKITLEFGCNYGATAIILACLGARVMAVDYNDKIIRVARENIARFGLLGRIELVTCGTKPRLPFPDSAFDCIVCNSVLEYVSPKELEHVQSELDRVLKPGGLIFVLGTSNRLAPCEVHSGRWLINYVPEICDHWLFRKRKPQRGVAPWRIRHGFGAYDNLDWLDCGQAYLEACRRINRSANYFRRMANWCARRLGFSLGLVTPSISVTLRKRAI